VESALEILDRLERVLHRHLGRLSPDQRQMIEPEVIGLVRMVRAALPKELHQTAWLQEEAEAALARAREEARRLILDAQAHARSLADARGPTRGASGGQAGADDLRREADHVRRGADEYAARVLQQLEAEVERVLAAIRRGQEVLRSPGASGRTRP
jgi:hypothetical protein